MLLKKGVRTQKYTFHVKHKETGKKEQLAVFAESTAAAKLKIPEDLDILTMEVAENGK